MEYPFYTKPWPPARDAYCTLAKPKIISIPVHDAGSAAAAAAAATPLPPRPDRSSAATKIQKAFRGFLVRKSMRTVREVAAEAEELAARIDTEDDDEGATIRRDARERLRVGEALMSLLLRLDSVRGVRDYRKRVIRRVIQLQEAVDSIAATAPPPDRAVEAPGSVSEEESAAAAAAEAAEAVSVKDEGDESLVGAAESGWMTAEAMERVAAESESMRELLAELCERSAQQSRVMGALAKRVEVLEHKVDRMDQRRKKKKTTAFHDELIYSQQ